MRQALWVSSPPAGRGPPPPFPCPRMDRKSRNDGCWLGRRRMAGGAGVWALGTPAFTILDGDAQTMAGWVGCPADRRRIRCIAFLAGPAAADAFRRPAACERPNVAATFPQGRNRSKGGGKWRDRISGRDAGRRIAGLCVDGWRADGVLPVRGSKTGARGGSTRGVCGSILGVVPLALDQSNRHSDQHSFEAERLLRTRCYAGRWYAL
jgi:hypothetical protein